MRKHRAVGSLRVRNVLFGCAAVLLFVGAAPQSGPTPIDDVKLDRDVDFNKDIYPIFKTNCLACHNASDAEGEVILETPETIRKGGEEGPIVVPGKAMESSLLKVVSRRAKPYMPPRKNKVGAKALTSREAGLLKLWIDQGAKGSGVSVLPPPTLKAVPSNWNPIYAVALDRKGDVIACGRGGRLFIYNIAAGMLTAQPVDPALGKIVPKGQPGLSHLDAVQSMTFSDDGSRLATGGYRSIKIWKKALSAKTAKVDLGGSKVLAITRDGSRLAAAVGNDVRVLDLSNGKAVATAKGHGAAVTSVAFTPDGKLLLTGSEDKTARSWNAADGKPIGVTRTPQPVTAVAWLVENKQIATGEKDNVIRVWNAPAPAAAPQKKKEEKKEGEKKEDKKPEAPKPIKELKAHTGAILVLSLDPSNPKRLLSGSADTRLRHWDLEKGSQIREYNHGGQVVAFAATPDGKRFVTVGNNKMAKIWDTQNGRQLVQLNTEGPARRDDREAQAYLGFVNNEVKYREAVVKAAEDGKKKEQDEVKKSTDSLPAAEKAVVDAKAARDKAIRDREGVDARLELAKEDSEFSKARSASIVQALGRTATPDTLKEFQASKAEADKVVAARAKVAEEAKKKSDAAGKAAADAKKKNDEAKKSTAKALADAQKALDEAAKKAGAAKGDAKKAADQAVAEATKKRDEARAKADAANAAEALRKAEAAKATADLGNTKAATALRFATSQRDTTGLMLAHFQGAVNFKKAEAAKAAADKALAVMEKAAGDAQNACNVKNQAIAAEKGKRDAAVNAFNQAKAKADQAAKALQAAGKDEKKRKAAEEAMKKADEALKKAEAAKTAAEQAYKKSEQDKQNADKALAEANKKRDDQRNKVNQSNQALSQAKTGADGAKRNLEQEKGRADQAVRNATSTLQRETRNQENAKRSENEKKTAWDVAKLNQESAKRRVEKAHEGVKKADQGIQEAKGQLAKEKEHQKKTDADRKKAAEAVKKASQDLLTGAISPDGGLLVLGAADGGLSVFGASSGRDSGRIDAHGKPVVAAAFLADGALVTVAEDGSVRRGGVQPTWKLERAIKPAEGENTPMDRVVSLAFSPDGKLLASGGGTPSREGELIIWNVADGKLVRKIVDAHSDSVYDVNFSHDGTMLASCAADKFAKVWDVKTGKRLNSFEGHTYHVLGVGWNRTGRSLATAGADNVIKVWDRTTGKQKRTISGFAKQVTSVRYVGYGETFAVSSGGTAMRLVGENGRTTRNFDSKGAFMYAVSVSADGQVLAGGGLDGVLRLWRTDNGQAIATFDPPAAK